MDKDTDAMARRNYGYGRWDAPYWFIGPEPGMAAAETLRRRVEAWVELGKLELNDCREFHCRIGEKRWHFRKRVALQPTWRRLMLLLMTFLERPTDKDSLRNYQRDKWGEMYDKSGGTCVIELSGLAAPNLSAPGDHGRYREERIKAIRRRVRSRRPKLVVMYGMAQRSAWEKIAGVAFPPEPGNFVLRGSTVLALARHPVAPGLAGDKYWKDLGRNLREFARGPAAFF